MKKFKEYIEKWLDGQKVRGIQVSLLDIRECVRIYNAMVRNEKPEFISCRRYWMEDCIMKDCNNCKHFWYDNSTGTSECGQYDNMTEDETDKYYTNGEDNCPFYKEDTN